VNKKLIFSVILAAFLLSFVAVMAFSQTSPSVRWEYTAFRPGDLSASNQVVQQANQLGREGWELVTFENGQGTLLFKRRLP
jgi:hypothetical protein